MVTGVQLTHGSRWGDSSDDVIMINCEQCSKQVFMSKKFKEYITKVLCYSCRLKEDV